MFVDPLRSIFMPFSRCGFSVSVVLTLKDNIASEEPLPTKVAARFNVTSQIADGRLLCVHSVGRVEYSCPTDRYSGIALQ